MAPDETMSTRSAILHRTATGYVGIYCHFDGYPEGVGQKLLDHYQDADKVARLIALGEISSLGERVEPIGPHSYQNAEEGTTVAYHRDRGEDRTEPATGDTVKACEAHIGHNGYVYVFESGAWTLNGEPLAQVIAGTAKEGAR